MHLTKVVPPNVGGALKVVSCKGDLIRLADMGNLQFLFYGAEPVIRFKRVLGVGELGWLGALKIIQLGVWGSGRSLVLH
jgi:hypothetical protein